jgi:NADH:ubiquinone oxidoreductase subunit E
MKLVKVQQEKTYPTYIADFGVFQLDINDLFFKVGVFAVIALAYNVGVMDAQEYLKFTAYFSANNEICDYNAGICTTYTPAQEGNKVVWKTTEKKIEFNNTYNFSTLGIK